MKIRDRLMRWWKPAQWNDEHPGANETSPPWSPSHADGVIQPQHGVGAESWDRIDTERDLRKP